MIGSIIFFALQHWLSSYGVWYLILVGVIAIVMTVRLRRGIGGLLASRSCVSLFPVGYRVDVTALVSTEPPERVGHE